jgi:predicted Zn-dependent protease
VKTARGRLAQGDAAGAEEAARKALRVDEESMAALIVLANALVKQERGEDALPVARRIVRLNPRKPAYRVLMGDVLQMTGDPVGAKTEWERALAASPDDEEIKRRLGL